MVDVRFEREFKHPITLATLKQHPALRGMRLLQRGSRLSVMPVTEKEWNAILAMEAETKSPQPPFLKGGRGGILGKRISRK
jgi:predicted RNA-binding protein with PUA-like domain